MISPSDIQVTKNDLTLFATILVVTNVVDNQLSQTPLFNEKWMNFAVATLLGVALHGLLTNKVSDVVNKQLETEKSGVGLAIYDLVKFGTIFIAQRVIVSYIEGRDIVFDQRWMLESGAIIAGYGVYSIAVAQMVPKIDTTYQPVLNDIIKVSMGALAANYLLDGTINKTHLMSLGGLLLSFVIFDLGIIKLVQ